MKKSTSVFLVLIFNLLFLNKNARANENEVESFSIGSGNSGHINDKVLLPSITFFYKDIYEQIIYMDKHVFPYAPDKFIYDEVKVGVDNDIQHIIRSERKFYKGAFPHNYDISYIKSLGLVTKNDFLVGENVLPLKSPHLPFNQQELPMAVNWQIFIDALHATTNAGLKLCKQLNECLLQWQFNQPDMLKLYAKIPNKQNTLIADIALRDFQTSVIK